MVLLTLTFGVLDLESEFFNFKVSIMSCNLCSLDSPYALGVVINSTFRGGFGE